MLVQKMSGAEGVKLDITLAAEEFETLAATGAVVVDSPATTHGFPEGVVTVAVSIGR